MNMNPDHEKALKLYEQNEKLVYSSIKRYFPEHYLDEDVQQTGRIGLWLACLKWDPEKGALSTLADLCIHNEIILYFRKNSRKRTVNLTECVPLFLENTDNELCDYIPGPRNIIIWTGDPIKTLLTKRQIKILRMKVDGLNQYEIGKTLGVSQATVARDIKKIRQVLMDNIADI